MCGKLLTEREGKSIVLAFFLVVAIKSNLSTFAAAKVAFFFRAVRQTGVFFLKSVRLWQTPSSLVANSQFACTKLPVCLWQTSGSLKCPIFACVSRGCKSKKHSCPKCVSHKCIIMYLLYFVNFWNASSMLKSSFCKVLMMSSFSTDHFIRLARMSVSPCGSMIQWLSFTRWMRPT